MPAERIVCLSAESAEILALLGQASRVAGLTAFAPRLPAFDGKPRISGFSTAKLDRILALDPDLVIGYSDVQADLAAALIRAGCSVLVTTQRTLSGIFETIGLLGGIVDARPAACGLSARLEQEISRVRQQAALLPVRPRVWFEEWMDPLISGVGWVDELIEIAGGEPLFPELRGRWRAQDRVVDPAEAARRNPQLILASWCGRRVRAQQIASRPGWESTEAVRSGRIVEIRSHHILQPGPSAILEGLPRLHAAIADAARQISGGGVG
jgi:iron complex transport system substrate-binding protein